eukprot:1978425-Rhodomonas_salina.1
MAEGSTERKEARARGERGESGPRGERERGESGGKQRGQKEVIQRWEAGAGWVGLRRGGGCLWGIGNTFSDSASYPTPHFSTELDICPVTHRIAHVYMATQDLMRRA